MNARQRKKRRNYDPYKKWHLGRRHYDRFHKKCPFCGNPCKRRTGYAVACPDCWWMHTTLDTHIKALTAFVEKQGFTLKHTCGKKGITFSVRLYDSMGNLHSVDGGIPYSDLKYAAVPMEQVLSELVFNLLKCL